MTDVNEIIASLEEMRSRFDSGFLSYDRELIEELHLRLFGKVMNRTCGNCYRDAYVLIYSKLKKDKTMPKIPNYEVKAGVLIHPFGTSDYFTNPLPNDEVALSFLAENENRISLFARYPIDWKEQVEKFKSSKKEATKEEVKEEVAPEKPVEIPTDTKEEVKEETPTDTKEEVKEETPIETKEEVKEESPAEEKKEAAPAKEKAAKSKAKK